MVKCKYLLANDKINLTFSIFKEKFERCNHIFTPEIESIMLASKVLRKNKNKKEVKNDLLSKMAPPILQSTAQLDLFVTLVYLFLR